MKIIHEYIRNLDQVDGHHKPYFYHDGQKSKPLPYLLLSSSFTVNVVSNMRDDLSIYRDKGIELIHKIPQPMRCSWDKSLNHRK